MIMPDLYEHNLLLRLVNVITDIDLAWDSCVYCDLGEPLCLLWPRMPRVWNGSGYTDDFEITLSSMKKQQYEDLKTPTAIRMLSLKGPQVNAPPVLLFRPIKSPLSLQ